MHACMYVYKLYSNPLQKPWFNSGPIGFGKPCGDVQYSRDRFTWQYLAFMGVSEK